MTNIQYGLISRTDAATLEKTINLIINEALYFPLNITEIGIFDGQTARGIKEYINKITPCINYTCIDNNKDKEVLKPFPECNLIIGNSSEVYNQLEDNSQHLIFVDGDHSFIGVISDFFAYADKVKVGGFFCFHDTGKHIKEFKDFQHGDKNNPDAYISVRKALTKLGLLLLDGNEQWSGNNGEHFQYATGNKNACWELIFDWWDVNDEAGGICCFKKLY